MHKFIMETASPLRDVANLFRDSLIKKTTGLSSVGAVFTVEGADAEKSIQTFLFAHAVFDAVLRTTDGGFDASRLIERMIGLLDEVISATDIFTDFRRLAETRELLLGARESLFWLRSYWGFIASQAASGGQLKDKQVPGVALL